MTLATRLVHVADAGYAVRQGLRALRGRLEEPRPRELYPVTRSRRPAHAVVALQLGTGHDPAALAKALKVFKKQLDAAGASGLVMRREIPSDRPAA